MPLLLFLDPKERQSVVDVKLLPEAFFIGEKKKKEEKISFRIQYDL